MKKIIISIILLLSLLVFNSCSVNSNKPTFQVNNNDWEFKLSYEYEIWHINSENIILGKRNQYSLSTVVDGFITEFCYNNKFVCIKRSISTTEQNSLTNTSAFEFFIVDMENDKIHGPYTESVYTEKKESLQIDVLSSWIKTVPRPEGATFSAEY